MNGPLVSIIVPIYNVEEYLERCIDSIIKQTYKNLEIILVNDGSTDKSGQICEEYAKKDRRIVYISKKNEGQSIARNAALVIRKGEYVAFVDSDDYLSLCFIEELYKQLQLFKADISVCEFEYVNASEKIIKKKKYISKEGIIEKDEFFRMETTDFYMFCNALWNKLFRSKIWDNLRFLPGKHAEDSFAMTEYIKSSEKIAAIRKPLYYYNQRNTSEVHHFTIKNLDSAEAWFIRAHYYISLNNLELVRNCIYRVLSLLNRAYTSLDLNNQYNKKRYNEIREEYKKLFLMSYNKPEYSKRFLTCYLYYRSEILYSWYVYLRKRTKRIYQKIGAWKTQSGHEISE